MGIILLLLVLTFLPNFAAGTFPNRIQYTRDFLLGLNTGSSMSGQLTNSPLFKDIMAYNDCQLFNGEDGRTRRKTRKRGKRGGVRQRVRILTRKRRLPLPSIVLANVQSLKNKMDELQARVSYTREFRDACVLAFTETWLTAADMDSTTDIDGFGVPVRLDRDPDMTGKRQGGGVCFYINPRLGLGDISNDIECASNQ